MNHKQAVEGQAQYMAYLDKEGNTIGMERMPGGLAVKLKAVEDYCKSTSMYLDPMDVMALIEEKR